MVVMEPEIVEAEPGGRFIFRAKIYDVRAYRIVLFRANYSHVVEEIARREYATIEKSSPAWIPYGPRPMIDVDRFMDPCENSETDDRRQGFRAGAEAMRERAALTVEGEPVAATWGGGPTAGALCRAADRIRALPLPGEESAK